MVSILKNLNASQILKGNFTKGEDSRNWWYGSSESLKGKRGLKLFTGAIPNTLTGVHYAGTGLLDFILLVFFTIVVAITAVTRSCFFFCQSIRSQTYKRHPGSINKNHAHRALWKLIQHISSMPPCSRAKIVVAKLMNYWTSKSGEFVNLTTCRLQNHNQVSVALPHAPHIPENYKISRQQWEIGKEIS